MKKRILVVDDEPALTRMVKMNLESAGDFVVRTVNRGSEAISAAREFKPDMIFLDVMMEGLDGYKTCKTIKSSGEAYIVMLTSKKSPFDKVRGTMSGCDAYVTKPPSDERLTEEIKKFLLRRPKLSVDAAKVGAG